MFEFEEKLNKDKYFNKTGNMTILTGKSRTW